MISKLLLALGTAALTWTAHAHEGHDKPALKAPAASAATAPALDAHTREDIERHLGMARAHQKAAQCLSEGTDHAQCQRQLQEDCRGLALGKQCGMRHAH